MTLSRSRALLRRRDVELTIADLERLEPDPREHRALRHNIRQLQREVEQRTADMRREYESSLSWRVTWPLRQARAAFSRRRG